MPSVKLAKFYEQHKAAGDGWERKGQNKLRDNKYAQRLKYAYVKLVCYHFETLQLLDNAESDAQTQFTNLHTTVLTQINTLSLPRPTPQQSQWAETTSSVLFHTSVTVPSLLSLSDIHSRISARCFFHSSETTSLTSSAHLHCCFKNSSICNSAVFFSHFMPAHLSQLLRPKTGHYDYEVQERSRFVVY